jgi:hypothetical protein
LLLLLLLLLLMMLLLLLLPVITWDVAVVVYIGTAIPFRAAWQSVSAYTAIGR